MIEILKASAGSGKTFNLAKKYIAEILVKDVSTPQEQWERNDDLTAYRHVLAVTFTNKATEEMKRRIIDDLYLLATNPGKSSHRDDFVPHPYPDDESLSRAANAVLCRILHDYGAFSVCTIDKFFQQALKSFSREIGHFASYQVELDKQSLVSESVDRLLDSLKDDEESAKLLRWLTDNAVRSVENGEKYSLEKSLLDVAGRLRSEEHRAKLEKLGLDEDELYSEENVAALGRTLSKCIDDYVTVVKSAVAAAISALSAAGIDPADTYKGFAASGISKCEGFAAGAKAPVFTATFRDRVQDPSKWFAAKNAHLASKVTPDVAGSLSALLDLEGDAAKAYSTAVILKRQVYGFGVASRLREEFNALLQEKNVLDLDDSNTLLKHIIDGTDAPFIYEKLGVRYEHFLLDEFQDTSRIQWDNLLPLLRNSVSQGFHNLIVGDVKQSIYRWRNSDWKLLQSELPEEFAEDSLQRPLSDNWRSLGNIVEFNNDFFTYAAAVLDDGDVSAPVSSIYSDVRQNVSGKKKGLGQVRVSFCGKDEENARVLESIRTAVGKGFRLGDIGVISRTRHDGADIASFLIDNGINVVTDDSLRVDSSMTVRRLVSILSGLDNPGDTLSAFLARELSVEIPDSHTSLVTLCEDILRGLKASYPDVFAAETAYIRSFVDIVRDFCENGGGGLHAFLTSWADNKASISSPELEDAVRIITVHKAKGLAYPYVIVPYLESISLFKSGNVWCSPDVRGTSLDGSVSGIFDVRLSKSNENDCFADDYRREKMMQAVDNINIAYVAFTRPREGMHIIAQSPEESVGAPTFAKILYEYVGRQSEWSVGELPEHTSGKDVPEAEEIPTSYPSWPIGDRLSLSMDSGDFFSEDGMVGVDASRRLRGIVLHKILSDICVPADLQEAVLRAVVAGDLDPEDAAAAQAVLEKAVESGRARGWFPDDARKVRTELDIIDTDGSVHRPDRVVETSGGGVVIIDYKFGGRRAKYAQQIAGYAGLYERMGVKVESAVVWYVERDEVVIC